MFQSEITLNHITYTIEFVDHVPTTIVVGKVIRVFKGSSVTERLRNYVIALLTVADKATKSQARVSAEAACKVVEAIIAPADCQITLPTRNYRGTGYSSLGDDMFLIKRDGA